MKELLQCNKETTIYLDCLGGYIRLYTAINRTELYPEASVEIVLW